MISLFPSKHVAFNESVIGIGAIILKRLGPGKTLDEIWHELRNAKASNEKLPEKVNLDGIVIAVTFLFLVGAVKQTENGTIVYAAN